MKVFIDDIRNPPDSDWILFRCPDQALEFLKANLDSVTDISFDHDMGGEKTTRGIAAWLEEASYNAGCIFKINTFIHSANPIGGDWLEKALERSTIHYYR